MRVMDKQSRVGTGTQNCILYGIWFWQDTFKELQIKMTVLDPISEIFGKSRLTVSSFIVFLESWLMSLQKACSPNQLQRSENSGASCYSKRCSKTLPSMS